MFNKPVTLRTIPLILLASAAIYVVLAACVNADLIVRLLIRPVTLETLKAVFQHADGAVAQWIVALFVVCLIAATSLSASGGGRAEFSSWSADDDRESEWGDHADDAYESSSWHTPYEHRFAEINPASGLFMVGEGTGGVDVAGNLYGTCSD